VASRTIHCILCVGISALAAQVASADPATQRAPEVIYDIHSPQYMYIQFNNLAIAGQLPRAIALLWFADDDAKKDGEICIGIATAAHRLDDMMIKAFGARAVDVGLREVYDAQRRAKVLQILARAHVSIEGDTATIALDQADGGATQFMVRRDGRWLFDWRKVMDGRNASAPDMAFLAAELKAYEDVMTEIRTGSIQSGPEAQKALAAKLQTVEKSKPEDLRVRDMREKNLPAIRNALTAFEVQHGRLPTSDEGLAALAKNPGTVSMWKALLPAVPTDAWGRNFIYRTPSASGATPYDLFSAGPDGKPDTDDDVKN